MRALWMTPVLLLLLAGCNNAGKWVRPGATPDDMATAMQACQAAADIVVGPEEGIDQDILATRGTDWQRSPSGGLAAAQLGNETHDRADKLVAGCMRAKGFTPAKQTGWW